jgi:hypothetical protein
MKKLYGQLYFYSDFFQRRKNEVYADGVFDFEENKTQKIFTDWTRVRQIRNILRFWILCRAISRL